METPLSDSKSRARTKSESADGQPASGDEEKAPNLNGSKDGGNTSDNTEIKESTEQANQKRKRKAEDSMDEVPSKKVDEEDDNANDETIDDEPMDTTAPVAAIKMVLEDESSANDSAPELKDIPISEKHTLGKGKRARVPNKRYSDIVPAHVRGPRNSENGQPAESDLNEILREESESEAVGKRTGSPALSGSNRKIKNNPDLQRPSLLKPLEEGWKRELVYRATNADSRRVTGDIYYYSPNGKKVRSMREMSYNLAGTGLSLENFSFAKEPIGVDDPEKEIIRSAKKVGTSKKMAPKVTKATKPAVPTKRPETPPVEPPVQKSAKSPKASFKVKAPKPVAAKRTKKAAEDDEEELEVGGFPATWSAATTPKKAKPNNTFSEEEIKPCPPCSITCEGVLGLIPTLQCRICLCLYHNECVGVPSQVNIQGYVCKNCQLEQETIASAASIVAPPLPLPPVNTINTTQTTPTPKRIPKSNDSIEPPQCNPIPQNVEVPKLTPKPGITPISHPAYPENKSIVGSLTTWFPSSSTIQVSSNDIPNADAIPAEPRRPQLVEFVGNKKYLIIPRHNILSVASVAPNIYPPAQIDQSATPETNVCDIKIEPESPVKSSSSPSEKTDPAITSSPTGESDQQDKSEDSNQQQQLSASEEKTDTTSKWKGTTRAKQAAEKKQELKHEPSFMDTYLQNLAFGYKTLLYVFQYLKVQDLLRAGRVCSMWRDISRHPLLWNTVRMKNSQIHSFDGLANALQQHGTVHLDLRKMLLPPTTGSSDDIWPSFTNAIKKVESLQRVELCRCLASVVEELATNNYRLEVMNAVTIKCDTMSFDPFKNLRNLKDLRIKSTAGLSLSSDLSALKELIHLKHLSITSIKDLNKLNVEVIGELVNLEVLDIGECTDFPKKFGPDILSKLVKLEKLRLEKGQGDCYTFDILKAVKGLENLQQLELVNFDIKSGFDKALGECLNIKKMLIIPTYISQSATTNHMVLGGVLNLQKTLSHFVWGVTLELLRVTELFVDQCEQPDKKDVKDKSINTGDSIPVLKPVPLHGIAQPDTPPVSDTPQVEILPLPTLQKLLLQNLPTTRVKILKIPFHATWRQSITDSGN